LPCQEIIEILDGSSSEDEDAFTDDENKKIPAIDQTAVSKNFAKSEVIVLCDSSSDEDAYLSIYQGDRKSLLLRKNHERSNVKEKRSRLMKSPMYTGSWFCSGCNFNNDSNLQKCCRCSRQIPQSLLDNADTWACKFCTYENQTNSMICGMCYQERPKMMRQTKRIIQDIIRKDTIDDIKQLEVDKSREQFNGFNIYGDQKRSTSTLSHLT
jgi:hypothetical protein